MPKETEISIADSYFQATREADARFSPALAAKRIELLALTFPKDTLSPLNKMPNKINPVDEETGVRSYDHLDLCRALGFGATAGLVLWSFVHEEGLRDQDVSKLLEVYNMDIVTFLDRGKAALKVLGEHTDMWLQGKADITIESPDARPWYPISAGLVIDLMADGELTNWDFGSVPSDEEE